MPDNTPFNYKVFISYKSQQESWARRLATTLRSFGLTVWRDHDADEGGIRLGESWSEEIRRGIRDAEKMMVLWSSLIANNSSTVVLQEIQEMHKYVQSDTTSKRGYIPISLDGTSFASYSLLSGYHGDEANFKLLYSKYGDTGAENASPIEWYEAIRPLIKALGIQDDIMEIRFVVAAMTHSQALELQNDPTKRVSSNAFELMLNLMSKTSTFDVQRYGQSPNEWKPFPQIDPPWSIGEIIENYDREKRTWLHEKQKYAPWIVVSYSDEIMSKDEDRREAARDALRPEIPCLVIVDPVSMMHIDVYNRILVAQGLQHHPKAFFLGIAPFISVMHNEIYAPAFEVWETLKGENFLHAPYERFSAYFESENRSSVLDIDNGYQFVRWLQVAVDSIILEKKTPMSDSKSRNGMHPSHKKTFAPKRPSPPSTLARLPLIEENE